MAIIHCEEKWEAMTVTETASDGYTGRRQFQLISDIPNESPAVVLGHSTLPQLGDFFPGSTEVRLFSRTPSRDEKSRTNWMVDLEYKSIFSQEERDRTSHRNPLDRAATIEIETRKVMRAYRRVKKSNFYKVYTTAIEDTFEMRAAANSATDPYEPVYEAPAIERVILIKKNLPFFPLWFLEYEDAVNSDEFTLTAYGQPVVIPRGCGKVGEIRIPKAKQENGTEYVQLSYQIVVRQFRELRTGETDAPEPWDDEILDAGMRTYDAQDSEGETWAWTNVKDSEENGVVLPVPFNGSGRPIDRGVDDKIAEDELWWSLVAPYRRKPFTGVLPIT